MSRLGRGALVIAVERCVREVRAQVTLARAFNAEQKIELQQVVRGVQSAPRDVVESALEYLKKERRTLVDMLRPTQPERSTGWTSTPAVAGSSRGGSGSSQRVA